MAQTLAGIILAIATLLSNPKVRADSNMLSQVNSMLQAIAPLAQEIAMTNSSSTVTLDAPSSTDTTQPIVINVQSNQPEQYTSPVLGAVAPTSTPILQSVPFESILRNSNPLFMGGAHDVYMQFPFDESKAPMNITLTLLNNTSTAEEMACGSSPVACKKVSSNTVNDPAWPDGLGGNMHFGNLASGTTYQYEIDITGDTWQTSSTGEFTTGN